MLKLQLNNTPKETVWVVDKNFTIGRSQENHLILDDDSVSPQHAKIVSSEYGFTLRELSGNDNTIVNGSVIKQRDVYYGDKIKVGDIEITLIDPSKEEKSYDWSLVAYSSALSGQEFPLHFNHEGYVTLGRGKKCDVAFPGTHLSKEHAKFHLSPRGLHVTDLQSDNGIFVDEERVTETTLLPGDKIRLDVYNFYVCGPEKCKFANMREGDELSGSQDKPHCTTSTSGEKHWAIRPTSPGNRSDAEQDSPKISIWVYLFSIVMIGLLIGLSAYLLL